MFFTLVLAFITTYIIIDTAHFWLPTLFELIYFLFKYFWKGIKFVYYFSKEVLVNTNFLLFMFSLLIGITAVGLTGWGGALMIVTYIMYKSLNFIKKRVTKIKSITSDFHSSITS